MKFVYFVLMFLVVTPCYAQSKGKNKITPEIKQKIVEAINYNFDACNRESIEEVMDSCADAMPRREQFRQETLKVFEEKDIHYSLVDVDILEINFPFALVRMVQKSHTLNRESKNKDLIGYRNQTGLLTEVECVEYLNTLKCENGKWKLLLIVSEMKPVVPNIEQDVNVEEEDIENETPKPKNTPEESGFNFGGGGRNCANGTCRPTPFNLNGARQSHGFNPPKR